MLLQGPPSPTERKGAGTDYHARIEYWLMVPCLWLAWRRWLCIQMLQYG